MPQTFRFSARKRDTTFKKGRITTQPIKWCGLLLALGIYPALSARACQGSPPQAPPTQEQVLSAARQYASRYMASLPSFICIQTTEQFEADKKAKHWRKGDSLISQLVWDQGREQRTLQLINDRPVSDKPVWRAPLVSEGEFGNLLDSVLGSASKATFQWRGWESVGEKRVGVFEYHVDVEHSPLRLTFGPVQAIVAFHGVVYTDESSGTVWRITNDADDFPADVKTKSVSRSVDYGEVSIGMNRYVLPVHATVLLNTGERNLRNELRFEGYRKFEADSHISFTPADLNKSGLVDPIKR